MKLTRGKLVDTLRALNNGATTYQARKIAGITVRRVNQIRVIYDKTGEPPVLGGRMGRPPKPIMEAEREAVRQAHNTYKVCADALE